MKSLILAEKKDFRGFNENINFENISKLNNLIYDICLNVPYIGYQLALEADFLKFDQNTEHILEQYDVIITIGPFLNKKYKEKQLLCYIEKEPDDLSEIGEKRKYDQSSPLIEQPYDIHLNNYNIENNGYNLSCPYIYDLNYFKQYNINHKHKNKIFVQRRTNLSSNFYQIFSNILKDHELFLNNIKSYNEYFKNLNTCEYSVSLCSNKAAGQVIAESCLLDVICFAKPNKLFSKLLLPKYCLVDNENEVIEKIKELQNNQNLKDEILNEIQYNKNKIDLKYFKNFIKSLYDIKINKLNIPIEQHWINTI